MECQWPPHTMAVWGIHARLFACLYHVQLSNSWPILLFSAFFALFLLRLTSSCPAVIITITTRGRHWTRNVSMGCHKLLSQSTCVFLFLFYCWGRAVNYCYKLAKLRASWLPVHFAHRMICPPPRTQCFSFNECSRLCWWLTLNMHECNLDLDFKSVCFPFLTLYVAHSATATCFWMHSSTVAEHTQ